MPPRPPVLPALGLVLALDLRLAWRDFRANFRLLDNRGLAALVLLLAGVMHVAAWSTGTQLADIGAADAAARGRVAADLAPGFTFILLLLLAQTLSGLTKTLYGHGDFDLILSSPFPARIVLSVRVLAVALGAGASAAIFIVPVCDVALLHGSLRGLALLPVLVGACLFTAALGLGIVMGLFALLGPRRTRLAAQIVATFIGGGFMLWLQLRRYLPADSVLAGAGWRMAPAGLSDVWRLPLHAAMGEGASLAIWLAGSALLFAAATFGFARPFANGIAVAASTADVPRRGGVRVGQDRSFRTGLSVGLRTKEWRLIRRDPWLLSQLLLQILYMTPMLAMLVSASGPDGTIAIALAPMIVVIAYQVSASMTWLSLSAEDAPDLLATAPVTAASLHGGKLISVAQLAAIVAAGPLLWLAWVSWRIAAETAGLAALGVAMAMALSLWHTKPAKRSGFAARHRESKLLALMEMAMSVLLGVTAALVVSDSLWAMVPLGLAGLVLLINRPRTRQPM